jgi:hypothetical protein
LETLKKVKCIDASFSDGCLSEGIEYSVISEEQLLYNLKEDDEGEPSTWYKRRFVEVAEEETVVNPSHYTRFTIQPLVFIRENNLSFWQGNVIKYVCREDAKGGLEDLKKAREYLDNEIKRREGSEEWWK